MLRSVYLRKIQHSALVLFTSASLVTLAGSAGILGCSSDSPAPAVNHAPTVLATVSATEVKVGTNVTLDASQSADADKDPLTFTWTIKSPAGSTASVAAPGDAKTSFVPDVAGTYAIAIEVSDGKDKASQSFSITVVAASQNAKPTASATTLSTDVELGTSITLDGSKSADPDPGDSITFAWSLSKKPAGSNAAISSVAAIKPTISFDLVGDYEVQLIVTDRHGAASDPAVLAIKAHEKSAANHAPTAVAEASALSVKVGQTVTVDATKSSDPDANDAITYAWTFTKVPAGSAAKFADKTASKTTFTADVAGEYVAQLVVTDSHAAASTPVTVTITATTATVNHAPTARAKASAAKVRPTKSVTIDGSFSTDPDTGDQLTYAWQLASAPLNSKAAISAGDAASAAFAFTPDLEGDYQFALVVKDNHGAASAPASVIVSASNAVNLAPVAVINAPPGEVEINALLSLDGSGSSDPDGDKLTYAWTLVSTPHASAAALSGATDPKATLTPDLVGNYVLSLVVTDDHGAASAPASVNVKAVDADAAPTAIGIATPANIETGEMVTLDATGSRDPENDPLSYVWTIVSQPAGSTAALSDAKAPKPTFTADVEGTYVFGLVANDGKKSSNEARVTVTATAFSPAPTARVVASSTEIRVGGSVSFDGSSSVDAGHQKLTYAWQIGSAPAQSTAALSASDGSKVDFTPDVKGFYVINLIVNDGKKSSSTAHVSVEVKEANPAPTARASISLNAASIAQKVTLDGSTSSDPENEPLTFAWSLESRPDGSVATIGDAATSRATFAADKIGQYVFTLTVTDPVGNTSTAKASLEVGLLNQVPTAQASAPKQALVGASVMLDGSASRDPENAPLSYAWSLNSAPLASAAAISNASAANPTFTPDKLGYYVFTLVVSDGTKSSQPVQVTVQAVHANLGPVVAAKVSDNEVEIGGHITLDSSGTYDPENDAVTYSWTIVSKPAGSATAIANPSAAKPSVTLDVLGRYEFRLAVSDGTTTTTSESIYAEAVANNAAPTAAATGPSKPVAVGTIVTLDGSGSHDPENQAITFVWTAIAVPQGSAATLSSATAKAPTFTADIAGDYVFQLVVSDGAKTSDPVTVSVKAE